MGRAVAFGEAHHLVPTLREVEDCTCWPCPAVPLTAHIDYSMARTFQPGPHAVDRLRPTRAPYTAAMDRIEGPSVDTVEHGTDRLWSFKHLNIDTRVRLGAPCHSGPAVLDALERQKRHVSSPKGTCTAAVSPAHQGLEMWSAYTPASAGYSVLNCLNTLAHFASRGAAPFAEAQQPRRTRSP